MTSPTINLFSMSTTQAGPSAGIRYMIDVTTCRDPIGQAHLRGRCKDGRDDRVLDWIRDDPKVQAIIETVGLLAGLHTLPPQSELNLSIGFHDHHGIWIAPAIAILAGRDLIRLGLGDITITHQKVHA